MSPTEGHGTRDNAGPGTKAACHSPASAWTGTHVVFDIARRAAPPWATERVDTAVLDFRHSGWDERSEYLGFCNFHWGEALQKLKRWCESP